MSMDLIHVLTFDCTGHPGDSVELADWVKADLLPVIEDVLDAQRAPGHRRIERLVLDLGTVTAEEAGSELPRRLREQLALALAEAPSAAPGEGNDLLAFLRTGAMPWRAEQADHAAHAALLRQVLAAHDAPAVLDTVLREPRMLTRMIRQFDVQALCAAAAALFHAWPAAQRTGALAWAAAEAQRLPRGSAAAEAFWRWMFAQQAHPGGAGALAFRWRQAAGGGFSSDAVRNIEHGLETADVAALAPYWDRLLASAPQCLRAAHPHLVARWLHDAGDAMLADLLGVVQADCAWLLAHLAASVPRARLAATLRPAMAQWLAMPVDTLAPHVVLAWVRAALPELSGTPASPAGAVDSTHFRAPLQVLGSLFARAEIITISKGLNAGAFAQLAPYWDRLLVLAPHWLRSEYPRLARTWAAGFDTEVLIDILSVVQAECCAPIEQLAGTLSRAQLHAALRPFLPGWFDAGVDRLPARAILDAVQCANPAWLEEVLLRADMAQLQRMWPAVLMAQRVPFRRIWTQLPAGARERAIARVLADLDVAQQVDVAVILQPAVTWTMAERAARGDSLDAALPFLLRADVASVTPDQLRDCWTAQEAPMQAALASVDAAVAAAQASEAALAAFVAACRRDEPQLGQLNSAQLHALVRAWARFRQADAFLDAIEAGALRAAAPHAYFGRVLQQALAGTEIDLDAIGAQCAHDAAIAAVQRSAPALRAYVAACQREDAAYGQLGVDQLHALVRAWAGFQDAGAVLAEIEAGALRAAAPHAYFADVLRRALTGARLSAAPETRDASVAAAQSSYPAWRAYVAACQREDARFGQLSADQLHALVRAWAAFDDAGPDLAAIEAGALRAASPHAYFGRVLRQALAGVDIDLADFDAAFAAAQLSAPAWRAYVAACQREDARFGQLSADQLHALVRAWAAFDDAGPDLAAIEAGALRAASPHAYFGRMLRQALAGVDIDLADVDAAFAAALSSAPAWRAYVAACQRDDAEYGQLSTEQLHALVRAWAAFHDAGLDLAAIEAEALRAAAPHAYFGHVLRQALAGAPVLSPAPQTRDATVAAAQLSEPAWRTYVTECQREDAEYGQLSVHQLHALVRAWARFRNADDFLEAIEAGALQAAAPHAYFGSVLRQALAGAAIDLGDIDADAAAMPPAPQTAAAAIAAAQSSEPALRDYVAACQRDDAQLAQLSADQLHVLVRTWAGFQAAAGAPLAAIDAAARLAAAPHAFFRRILQQAMRGVPIDVDAIDGPAPVTESAASRPDSPVAPMLLQALPRRLADALLRGDLSPVEAIWPQIVRYHPDLLAEAAQRYLGRADARERLLGAVDAGKLHDLLGCVSAPAGRLVAPLVTGAAQFAILLPAPLAPDAFQQRVLRVAFAQALERTAPAGWIAGLLRAVMPGQSEVQCLPVAHAWHELLRGSGTALEAALADALHGRACLQVALQRVSDVAVSTLAEPLQTMLTAALCRNHPALTDQLLAHGQLAGADPAVFSVAEWQDLARAQLPRQPHAARQAFWRAFAAHQDANQEPVHAAFAAAFGALAQPAADAAIVDAEPAGPALPQAAGGTLSMLLMQASAPDAATSAAITMLAQRLPADAADAANCAALRSALADAQAVERLTAILPGPTLARLLCVLQPALAGALPAVLRAVSGTLSLPLSAVPATLDPATWRAIFAAVFTGPVPASGRALAARLAGTVHEAAPWLDEPPAPGDPMAQLLQPLAAAAPARAAVRSVDAPLPFTGDANVRNAGLVLIAPYIERLFSLLDITRDGVFVSDETRQRGVHLLQYAVTAEEATPEYLLALNKLLCGIPAAVPVTPGITISDQEKDTIEQLLGSVVAHWGALGSSTVAALRETFLQREGALYLDDEAWRLKIPQRTFDMLLDRLPWGYKLIKLTWMAAPLTVTWR
jgi:hypothetical protein